MDRTSPSTYFTAPGPAEPAGADANRGVEPVLAVIVDLDDTLFPQHDWLAGAWRQVAAAAAGHGVDPADLLAALEQVAAEGSARGGIIDRALDRIGARAPVDVLVAAFLGHRPQVLHPYPRVREALALLRSRVPLAVVTDGNVEVQAGKLAALGLADQFDSVVLSDRFGREARKPHPMPFLTALTELGVRPEQAVFIGDRPDKDMLGAARLGIRPVRVLTGEYAAAADVPGAAPWFAAAGFAEAVDGLVPHLG